VIFPELHLCKKFRGEFFILLLRQRRAMRLSKAGQFHARPELPANPFRHSH